MSPFSQPANDFEAPVGAPAEACQWITYLVAYALTLREGDRESVRAAVPVEQLSTYDMAMQVQRIRADSPEGRAKKKRDDYAEDYRLQLEAKAEGKRRYEESLRAGSGAVAQAMVPGADFVLDASETPVAVWGDGNDVLLADGEALMIVGKAGVGKTTIANQFLKARLGITDKALGYPVQPTQSKVLYLACDRPKQVARAMARIFGSEDREALNRLKVWSGPPPFDFAQNADVMLNMALEAGADTIIVDSLKDVAIGLTEDNVGSAYNRARQLCLVNGVTVVELHHQVKRGANGASPNTMADVYGSTWLTAGAGSVILLDGDAGDPVVTLKHLKQPVNAIGPVDIIHDHETGISTMEEKADLVTLAYRTPLTARDAAKVLFDIEKPSRAQKETARRKLDALCRAGQLQKVPAAVSGPDTYAPALSPFRVAAADTGDDTDGDGALFE